MSLDRGACACQAGLHGGSSEYIAWRSHGATQNRFLTGPDVPIGAWTSLPLAFSLGRLGDRSRWNCLSQSGHCVKSANRQSRSVRIGR